MDWNEIKEIKLDGSVITIDSDNETPMYNDESEFVAKRLFNKDGKVFIEWENKEHGAVSEQDIDDCTDEVKNEILESI